MKIIKVSCCGECPCCHYEATTYSKWFCYYKDRKVINENPKKINIESYPAWCQLEDISGNKDLHYD